MYLFSLRVEMCYICCKNVVAVDEIAQFPHSCTVLSCFKASIFTIIYNIFTRGSRVRFPEGAGNFSLHHRVQNGSGAHPASYQMGTRGSFLGGKAAGA
jgi:hypothetical protein